MAANALGRGALSRYRDWMVTVTEEGPVSPVLPLSCVAAQASLSTYLALSCPVSPPSSLLPIPSWLLLVPRCLHVTKYQVPAATFPSRVLAYCRAAHCRGKFSSHL